VAIGSMLWLFLSLSQSRLPEVPQNKAHRNIGFSRATLPRIENSYVLSLMRSLYLITAMVILERGILDYHIYEESPSLQIITENYIKLLTNLHPVL
jgi:hypothetical protein